MITAQVLTRWDGDGIITPYHPEISSAYSLGWNDITGQDVSIIIPEINIFVVEVTCDLQTLEAIENDPNYQVIWSEEQTDQTI